MVNSLPSSLSSSDLKNFVTRMSRKAAYLFVTSNDADYYESFGADWEEFVDVMPRGQGGKGVPVKGGHR